MGGFLNASLNSDFRQGLCNIIIEALIRSCELMEKDCLEQGTKIQNHEEKIRNHLVENYLENDEMRSLIGLSEIRLRFYPEMPENYDTQTNSYVGRTDIRVVSEDTLKNRDDYFIIECKRIDGTQNLNKKYVKEGICRFVGETPKYLSYNKTNIMLGFIVANIDIAVTISAISELHMEELGNFIIENIIVVVKDTNHILCKSVYSNTLTLNHLFYNMPNIIL